MLFFFCEEIVELKKLNNKISPASSNFHKISSINKLPWASFKYSCILVGPHMDPLTLMDDRTPTILFLQVYLGSLSKLQVLARRLFKQSRTSVTCGILQEDI